MYTERSAHRERNDAGADGDDEGDVGDDDGGGISLARAQAGGLACGSAADGQPRKQRRAARKSKQAPEAAIQR
eukprot:613697-Pyramimonas_sp.AAC.1